MLILCIEVDRLIINTLTKYILKTIDKTVIFNNITGNKQ